MSNVAVELDGRIVSLTRGGRKPEGEQNWDTLKQLFFFFSSNSKLAWKIFALDGQTLE